MKSRNEILRKLAALALVILVVIVVIAISNALRPIPGSGLESGVVPSIPIAVGGNASYAITADGILWRWGLVSWFGGNNFVFQEKPQKAMENMTAVATRGSTTMMICSNGTLWTQGRAIQGMRHWIIRYTWMLTPLQPPHYDEPTAIMHNVTSISMGTGEWAHVMAITSDGGLWGWGYNDFDQLGIWTNEGSRRRPIRVMDDVVAVSAGSNRTFVITSDGRLLGWGDNRFGRLGTGTSNDFYRRSATIMANVIYVTSNGARTFALTSDGILWGWGSDWRRHDDPEKETFLIPTKMMRDVIAVSASNNHVMVIASDGVLWAWGNNEFGQLGDGTTENHYSPVRIMDNVVAVSAGTSHTLAVTADGWLWAWGNNEFGQLGDGTTENRHSPVRIMDGIQLP